MATTVMKNMLTLAMRIDKETASGQKFQDTTSAVTITGAANNGSGLIRITAANHGFVTGNQVFISGIVGTTEANNTLANPNWTITVISSSTFDLQSSTFSNAWVSGGLATGALIGSVGGSQFSRQRLLDIYNEARITTARTLRAILPADIRPKYLSGILTTKSNLQFTSGVAAKPSDYLETERLEDSTKDMITVLPVSEIQNMSGLISSTNRVVFDYGTNLQTIDSNTTVPDASTYVLRYYGIANFVLNDVFIAATSETFNDEYVPLVLSVAEMISHQAAKPDIDSIIKQFVGVL